METLHKFYNKQKFDRELIIAEDGGTIGIDWYIDDDGLGKPMIIEGVKPKPILILVPGLGGGSDNLYTHGLASVA